MTQPETAEVPPGTEAHEPEIHVHLDAVLRRANKTQVQVAEAIGIHSNNLSRLRNGHVSFIRLDTLAALCEELDCQPGDLLTYE